MALFTVVASSGPETSTTTTDIAIGALSVAFGTRLTELTLRESFEIVSPRCRCQPKAALGSFCGQRPSHFGTRRSPPASGVFAWQWLYETLGSATYPSSEGESSHTPGQSHATHLRLRLL